MIPWEGPWVDFTLSKFLGRRSGFQIRCEKAKIFRWSRASFKTMTVGSEKQHSLLTTGPGSICLGKSALLVIDLEDLQLTEVYRFAGVLSSWPLAKGLEGRVSLKRLRASFSGDCSEGLIRILSCTSDDFSLRGGLAFKNRHITKAHLYLSLAPSRLKKLPRLIRSSFSDEKKGWAGVHIVFYKNQLTFSGRYGPLFQAKWQSPGLG